MKQKLITILTNPFFIALIISLVIIYFLPDYFTKYKVELKEQATLGTTQRVYFEDLNGDDKSEKIVAQETTLGDASFIIYTETGSIIDQWNFSKKYALNGRTIQFYDLDKNGYSEIYFITQKKDSVFFNCIEPLNKSDNNIMEIFIDTIGEYNNAYPVHAVKFMFDGSASHNKKEVFFSISSGFSGYPRNAYKINIDQNLIIKSPHLTNHSGINYFADLDGDGLNEILIGNGSAGNNLDSTITSRSDYSSWLMVLDDDLTFLFEPIEFNTPFSGITLIPIENKEQDIFCLSNSQKTEERPDKLLIYSNNGQLKKELNLPIGSYVLFKGNQKNNFILFNRDNGHIQNYNANLKQLEISLFLDSKTALYPIDIAQDGKNEWLVMNYGQTILNLYDENFKNPVEFQIPNNSKGKLYYGLKQIGKNKNELYFQKGGYYYVYKYGKNPIYFFRYFIYLGIFLLAFGLVWLIMKGQKIRMEKQRVIENQISELQIKTIKNQVDPHFVFNAVNTISEMMLMDDKMEADRFISKFSKLMRTTLQKSDKITTTLQEEIDYVENYIQLQQIRFSNSFNYQIIKDIHIDYQTMVPKHVLYSYVENAIKHGLSSKSKDGLLTISSKSQTNGILLTIEDNGGGIDKSKNNQMNSTGSGVKIMEEMFILYQKLYKKKIKHKMIELFDDNGNKVGVRVEIKILI